METSNNPVFTLTIAQLHDFMMEVIMEALRTIEPKKEETAKYLTRIEACKALKISLPTLSRYSELGLIPAKRIGNRILYSEEDLKEALKEIPSNKFRK
jgi:excisionase family DNA binding protein